MATRFYLPPAGSVPISPAVSSNWESSWQLSRYPCSPTKSNTSFSNVEGYDTPGSTPFDICRLQFISAPLSAQTITGTVKGQIRVYEGGDDDDCCRAVVIRVLSNDGATVRGTLLAHFPSSLESEWVLSATNRYFPPSTSVDSVDAQDGDRLVIEIGSRRFAANFGYHRYRMGDNNASDLPEDETSTSDYNPWIEFSQTLDFLDEVWVGHVQAVVEYEADSPKIIVGHIGVQVEFTPTPPGQFTYTGNVTEITSVSSTIAADYEYTGDVGAVVGVTGEYSFQDGTDFTYTGNVTVVNTISSTLIWGRVCVGSVYAYIGVAGETSAPTRIYTGNIQAIIGTNGTGSTPIPGWDKYFGYGLVEVDDLDEPPPFWCVEEGDDNEVIISAAPEANYSFYAEFDLETDGGLEFGGSANVIDFDPSAVTVETLGEVKLGGELQVAFVDPQAYDVATSGGALIGGELTQSFVDPADIPVAVKETRGGMLLGGATGAEFADPSTYITSHTTSGELRIGEIRRTPVEHVVPGAADSDITTVVTAGGVEIGGTAAPTAYLAPESALTTTSGGVEIGGACTIAWEVPLIVALEINGGMAAGGLSPTVFVDVEGATQDVTSEVFETWVLNGFNFEPSMYSGFPFNSYAAVNGEYLAAGEDGIYLLSGDDDDGAPIHPGVRLGPMNFNTTNRKRVRSIHMQACGDTTDVRLSSGNQESFFSLDNRDRISASRSLQSNEITVEISDFESLSQIEITPVILEKR